MYILDVYVWLMMGYICLCPPNYTYAHIFLYVYIYIYIHIKTGSYGFRGIIVRFTSINILFMNVFRFPLSHFIHFHFGSVLFHV